MTIIFRIIPGCPPNVVHRYDDGGNPIPEGAFGTQGILSPLTDVILPLARRHPDWRFETAHSHARHFTVFKGTEPLGEILTTYRNYHTVAKVRNDKIRAEISKGDGMASQDAAKVRKLVEKYFVPKTEAERLQQKRDELLSALSSLEYTARNRARTKQEVIAPQLLPALIKQHGDVVHGVAASLSIGGVDALVAAYEEAKLFADFHAAAATGKNVACVVCGEGEYWVTQGRIAAPTLSVTFTDATLPLQLKTNIGLLKLAGNNAAYEGVGVRIAPDLFLTVYNPEG